MSPAETKLRSAQEDWAKAMDEWVDAQERIRVAKAAWAAAQTEFFSGIQVLAFQATCSSGCSGCPSAGGK